MKLVSIIIPYYKKRNYIHRAIKSILKQSYKKFEIIIVYNDPDKNDLPYIKKIKKIDKRIHLIINTSEVGAGHSRNIGIKKCKGDFIAFLDSDDEWKKK
ncbi:glycosyltransferase family 2 protein [Candidatus Pelagibacter sp.]|nr:glycosyltransferase family 2 protein [Candidatus Pelagibacter sp.]